MPKKITLDDKNKNIEIDKNTKEKTEGETSSNDLDPDDICHNLASYDNIWDYKNSGESLFHFKK